MEDAGLKACVAMGAIAAMEVAALIMGYDGTILAASVGTVAGLGGLTAGIAIGKTKK